MEAVKIKDKFGLAFLGKDDLQLCEGLLTIFMKDSRQTIRFKSRKIQNSNRVSRDLRDEVLDLGSYKTTVYIDPSEASAPLS